MTVFAASKSPLPSPPPQAGEGIEGSAPAEAVMARVRAWAVDSLSRLRGRVGEGAFSLELTCERDPLWPEEPQGQSDD
jgi:hypothetical protein